MILEDFLIRYGNIEVTEVYLGDVMLTDIYRAIFSLTSNIGFRHNINEAIKANKAAGVWGMASGWTPEQLKMCMIFQDAAGTIPVFAPEQPCGLLLDGRYKPGTRGPEGFVDPTFSNAAVTWILPAGVTPETGGIRATAVTGVIRNTAPVFALVVGKWYEVSIEVLERSAGQVSLPYDGTGPVYLPAGTGTFRQIFLCDAANPRYVSLLGGFTGKIGAVSFKEVPGVHLTQATVGARPVASARVNLFSSTGTLSTQSVTTIAASYVMTFGGVGSVTLSGAAAGIYNAGTHSISCTADSLTATVSGSVTSADLRLSINATPSLPAYQRVTSPTDYDTNGFPYKLKFNGTNQWMQHAALDLTGTDEVTVWAGFNKFSDVSNTVVYEQSITLNSNPGTVALFATTTSGFPSVGIASKGTITALSDITGNAAPKTMSIVFASKVSAPLLKTYINNNAKVTRITTQGTGNYGNHVGYIGARAGASTFFNGEIFELGLVGKVITDNQIAALRRRVMKGLGL